MAALEKAMLVLDRLNMDPERELPLCRRCSGISVLEIQKPEGYLLHNDINYLRVSANFCRLCRLVMYQLKDVLHRVAVGESARGSDFPGHPGRHPVWLLAHRTETKVWIHTLNLNLNELQWSKDLSKLI